MAHGAVDAADRGRALLDLGRAGEAETQFRLALASEPDDADHHVFLAQSLIQQGRHGEGRDAARNALAVEPDHVGGLVMLSAALAGLGEFDAALIAVRRGLQIAPSWAELHRQEGALLLAQDRPVEALPSLQRARSLAPEDPHIAALAAAALFNARRFTDAEEAVAQALRLDPDHAEAHRIRGLLSLRRGGGRAAVDAHRQALRLDPTEAEYREGLSVAMKSRNPLYGLLLRFGDWQQGLPDATRWLVFLAPFLASRVLRPFEDQWWARALLVLVFVLVMLTWTLEPVMNTVLLCSRYGRNLLPRGTRLATWAFLAYVTTALGATVVGLATHSGRAMVLAMGLALWSVSAGQTHLVRARFRTAARWLHGAGALLAVAATTAAAAGLPGAAPLSGALVGTGLLMLFFTSVAVGW